MGLVDIRRESPMLAMASKCPSVRVRSIERSSFLPSSQLVLLASLRRLPPLLSQSLPLSPPLISIEKCSKLKQMLCTRDVQKGV